MAIINELQNLGNAVRERTSTTALLTMNEMADKVRKIPYPQTDTITITANGSYSAPTGIDGYSKVDVNVEPTLESITITENGTYTPQENINGYNEIIVNTPVPVDPIIQEITITENGTYSTTDGVDGYNPIIVNIPTGGGELPELEYTGNISGYFSPNINNMSSNNSDQAPVCQLITILGDKIKFNNIESLSKAFQYNQIKHLPSYEFNLVDGAIFGVSPLAIFYNCYNLEELDVRFKGVLAKGMQMFESCYRLRTISDNVFKDATFISEWTGTNFNAIFKYCYSLRKVPKYFFDIIPRTSSTTNSYHFYYALFQSCFSLDEVKDLPVVLTMPSGCLNYTFSYCNRIKEITFETNEDGTPKDAGTTTNVLLDLSSKVGYGESDSYILDYNSGITADKKVYDDATYQALKDDPDWYSLDINYSRYNHDSAVNTINSLPTSTGSNTIKFQGQSGSLTDGGAINTLTEEEIAVATSRGWTVSLV